MEETFDFSEDGYKRFKKYFEKKRRQIAESNMELESKKEKWKKLARLEDKYHSLRMEYLSEKRKEKINKLEGQNCYTRLADAINKMIEGGKKMVWANKMGSLYFQAVQKNKDGFYNYQRN